MMTKEQLANIKIGDVITLRERRGKVMQVASTWFMITWEDGNPEIIRRRASILTGRLQLELDSV